MKTKLRKIVCWQRLDHQNGSFKKIFDYFSPRLKSFLMRSGADEAIAEEIIQETMTIIWTKADYYDPKMASPSTWIYTIARNKKIDILTGKCQDTRLRSSQTTKVPAPCPKSISGGSRLLHLSIYCRHS